MLFRKLSWQHVATAVKHEMFPVLSTSMQSSMESVQFDAEDFGKGTTARIIGALHEKRRLSTMEVAAIEDLVKRTADYKKNGERTSCVLISVSAQK